ncbi:hypothetical protein ATANTOWER_020391 [Ataeniobius toweri]|uniref:Protein yippee-like n=1 Tax=Ataeniobius toweri TaxID=208326 RepID=A0ABU7A838_9TELE|nr:hypothetical protein [Ataeniobius toweri]
MHSKHPEDGSLETTLYLPDTHLRYHCLLCGSSLTHQLTELILLDTNENCSNKSDSGVWDAGRHEELMTAHRCWIQSKCFPIWKLDCFVLLSLSVLHISVDFI